jgi:hypothetical protein
LVDRKIPPPSVPARRFGPEAAKALTVPPYGPLVCTHWLYAVPANGAKNNMMRRIEHLVLIM